jgi:hypothetical protein
VKALVNYLRCRATPFDVNRDVSRHENTVFHDLEIDRVIDGLRKDGVFLGLHLSQDIVKQIVQFAKSAQCYGNGKPYCGFHYHEKDRIARRFNINFSTADYYNTSKCNAIKMLIEDPIVLKIASIYLGGPPMHQGTRLRWSFCADSSGFEKYKYNQAFHYDLDDYSAMKFFFYLTDVGMHDGPHVCISGSHKLKRLSHKLFRGIYNEEALVNYYKPEKFKFIYGNSGYGFVEDASIMHKGLTPVKNDRLILIIEYAVRDYGMQHDRIKESRLKCIH